ncbi:MAG TPA: NADH-quinone oxidoreductase subunit NuoH [Gemmatimonadales bacterium]|nr:NADH-quinone oxidoreductase subunit NuoH [Gemmatimonadales bacterium]
MTPEFKGFLLVTVIKMIVVFTVVMVGVALLTLMERKVSAWMQIRLGPNRVGFWGLLQPAADGVKNIIKEETLPARANPVIFTLAPALAFVPALTLSAIIPWAAPLPLRFDFTLPGLGRFVHDGLAPMAVADVPVGFLFIIAISSLGVYGISLAGWSSNSKYALLGGLRASAQMISYEVAMGLALVPVLLLTGNVALGEIIRAQQQIAFGWFILPLFIAFYTFLVSGFAETNRLPFDLPEAESELITGYHTEYSAMKFSMFFIAEYANMVTVSAMVSVLFLGGWDIPFTHWDEQPGLLQTVATGGMMFLKTFFWLFFFMWIRWTLPRFRYDQLMALGWKVLMPIGLAYVMLVATALWALDALGVAGWTGRLAVLTGINLALGYVIFVVLDRGLVIRGARDRSAAVRARAGARQAA